MASFRTPRVPAGVIDAPNAAILIQPLGHWPITGTDAISRNTNDDPDGEALLGLRHDRSGITRHDPHPDRSPRVPGRTQPTRPENRACRHETLRTHWESPVV